MGNNLVTYFLISYSGLHIYKYNIFVRLNGKESQGPLVCKVISEPDKQVTGGSSFSRICSVCFSSIGPGSSHECCSSTAGSNLIILAFTLGSLQAEQVASGILKKRIEDENIKKSSQFKLSTGGNPMVISLGCAWQLGYLVPFVS